MSRDAFKESSSLLIDDDGDFKGHRVIHDPTDFKGHRVNLYNSLSSYSLRHRVPHWASESVKPITRLVRTRFRSGYRTIRSNRRSIISIIAGLVTIVLIVLLFLDGFRLKRTRYLISACSIQFLPESISTKLSQFVFRTSYPNQQSKLMFYMETNKLDIDKCPTADQLVQLEIAAEQYAPKFHALSYQSPMIDTRQSLTYPYSPFHIAYPGCEPVARTSSLSSRTSVKAALVVLVGNRTQDLIELQDALEKFSIHVNSALDRDYPAYIVYETTEWVNVKRQLMIPLNIAMQQRKSRLKLVFIPHTFTLPEKFNPDQHPTVFSVKRSRYGYQNMCRFWFKNIFSLKPIRELDYFMRLDSDSYLGSDFKFDPFLYMQHQSMDYGYLHAAPDDTRWTRRLWPFLRNYSIYAKNRNPSAFEPRFQSFHWPDDATLGWLDEHDDQFWERSTPHVPQFYNNFEIVRVGVMIENPAVAQFMRYVDETDPFGMLTLRWGDAPLRFITMSMFSSDEKTLMLNLLYQHDGWMIWKYIPPRPISWVDW